MDAPSDDSHLTIRIPSQRAYIERQSSWTSQRGKPRCDYCRASNLKCDRILPVCNYCSWANQHECTYAPTPNTSHRGIPRCDRCRKQNLKCDRDIPSCSFCKEVDEASACVYPSKLKHKPLDPLPASIAVLQANSKKRTQVHQDMIDDSDEKPRRSYYRESAFIGGTKSTNASDIESDQESSHRGRFTADFAQPRHSSLKHARYTPPSESELEFVSHPSHPKSKIQTSSGHIEPRTGLSYIPLPNFVCRELLNVNLVEMPKRLDFDIAIEAFQKTIMEPLRETAFFSDAKYGKLARCLASGDMSSLSERMRSWAGVHRLASGSLKHNIVLVPRDSVFSMTEEVAEADRRRFVEELLKGTSDLEMLQAPHYDILPAQHQLYDVLTYAHRYHYPAASMLLEVVRLRFAFVTWPMAEMYVKLCPLCSIRSKPAQEKAHRSKDRGAPATTPTPTPPPA